jgi:putative restriction endonuclease
MSAATELLLRIAAIRVYKKNRERAPSKPLFLLLLLSDLQNGLPRMRPFSDVEPRLTDALKVFGLATKSGSVAPQYPFWRLQHDGLADFKSESPNQIRRGSSDPTRTSLRKTNSCAGFTEKDFNRLASDLSLQSVVVHQILEQHFPRTIHEDLIRFFNLRIQGMRSGDVNTEGEFRKNVLFAYGNRCAITGYGVEFLNQMPGLEAAHICWPQAGGNDQVSNGIAMNSLSAKLFHLGLFGIDNHLKVIVSGSAKELPNSGVLSKIHGKTIRIPTEDASRPNLASLEWHMRWVFKG